MYHQDLIVQENLVDTDYLEERFGMLPFGVSQVDKLGGLPLYSSDGLKKKILEAFDAQHVLYPVMPALTKLVNDGKILPCFASRNLLKLIAHKLFSDPMSKAIRGFFASDKNKVYLLLDNNTTFGLWVKDKDLTYLTLHELQHYAAYNIAGTGFLRVNDAYLTKFYGRFFREQLGVKMEEKHIQSIYYYIFTRFERSHTIDRSSMEQLSEHLFKTLKSYIPDDGERERAVRTITSPLRLYVMNANKFIGEVHRASASRTLVINLLKSYKAIGVRRPNTLAIQELLYPSEVICIQSQYNTQKNNFEVINMVA